MEKIKEWHCTLFSCLSINTNFKASLLLMFSLLALLALVACVAGDTKKDLKSGEAAAFISVWEVPDDDKTIELPLVETDDDNVGMYDFQVDWGDGSTVDTISAWDSPKKTHTYTDAREYTVTITGSLVGWRFGNGRTTYTNPHAKKLVEVKQWGNFFLGKIQGFQFKSAENLEITADDAPFLHADNLNIPQSHPSFDVSFLQDPDLVKTINLNSAFYGASKLQGNLDWDVSTVVSMESAFESASEFNQNIGDWNVANVTNMRSMFNQATEFNQDIGDWKVGNVINMTYMFYNDNASKFDQDIGDWKVENVTNMACMFCSASLFNQDIGDWNVANVTNMETMFYNAMAFNRNIGGWNMGKVTNMAYMFADTKKFNQDIGRWNVANVTTMKEMFDGAEKFNQDIGDWNVANVINMTYMFNQATEFNQDISTWAVGNVKECTGFFRASGVANTADYHPNFTQCNP